MQGLGDVATIGRMELFVTNDKLKDIVQSKRAHGPFCEQLLLDVFGASKVESFDYSDYENATYVADLNLPLDTFGKYDTIFDGGTLEHIYNVPQLLIVFRQTMNVVMVFTNFLQNCFIHSTVERTVMPKRKFSSPLVMTRPIGMR